MLHGFEHVKIECIAGVTGSKSLDVLTESLKCNIPEKKAKRFISSIGFSQIKVVQKPKTVGDMCIEGAKKCMVASNTSPNEIDALIFISQSHDYIVPATSYTMQNRLGLNNNIIMLDLVQGCSGFVYGLFYASTLIESKICRKVLVCCGDLALRDLDCFVSQKSNNFVFADGAGVALLSFDDKKTSSSYLIKSYGEKSDVVMNQKSGFRYYRSLTPSTMDDFKINGVELASFEVNEGVACVKEHLSSVHLSFDDLSYLIIHQCNRAVINSFALSIDIDLKKVPFLAENTGNTSSASIPLGITENIKNLPKLRTNKTLLLGIGVGLSIASGVVDLSETLVLPTVYLR